MSCDLGVSHRRMDIHFFMGEDKEGEVKTHREISFGTYLMALHIVICAFLIASLIVDIVSSLKKEKLSNILIGNGDDLRAYRILYLVFINGVMFFFYLVALVAEYL